MKSVKFIKQDNENTYFTANNEETTIYLIDDVLGLDEDDEEFETVLKESKDRLWTSEEIGTLLACGLRIKNN